MGQPASMSAARRPHLTNGWEAGPLPPDIYYWGGVVTFDENSKPHDYFLFADFHGDYAMVNRQEFGGETRKVRINPPEVAYYNNSLTYPFKPQEG